MLVEKERKEALKAFLNGRKVRVISEYDDGSAGVEKLEDMFPEDFHYLVDVPAYEKPEFEQSVKDMVESRFEVEDKKLAASKIEYTTEEDTAAPPEEPEVKEAVEPPAKKKRSVKDIIEPLVRKGLSNQEIAKQTGIKYGTIWAAAKPIREELEKYIGKNADRHLCETCKFRMTGVVKNNGAKCDYLSVKEHSRGCTVEDCNVYEKGEPVGKKKKGFKTAYV